MSNADDGIAAAKEIARQGISDAYDAAQDALSALGIAQGAQNAADKNTSAIQVTEKSIAALVEGIHFDASGKITNIDTSGLVTTDDFNVLLSKKVNFDSGGHITNISTSGLVTEAGFAQMFSDHADHNGYVKRAEISTFITEDDAGRLISNAVISADQIRLEGIVTANDHFKILKDGSMECNKGTFNNIVVESGTFKGELITTDDTVGKTIIRNGRIEMFNWNDIRVGFIEFNDGSPLFWLTDNGKYQSNISPVNVSCTYYPNANIGTGDFYTADLYGTKLVFSKRSGGEFSTISLTMDNLKKLLALVGE